MVLLIGLALMLPALQSPREIVTKRDCSTNLRLIGLALHNYHETYGSLPPAYTVDAQGKRLHSWRTLILPFLDQQALYDKINLGKPWDDPANAEVRATTVRCYACPVAELPPGYTTYLAVVGENFCFHPTRGRKLSEITDNHHETVAVFETDKDHAVYWMAPDDGDPSLSLEFDDKLAKAHAGKIFVLMAGGSLQYLKTELTPETRKALMTIAGGETVGEF
ncbi:DUF1559 family PulG-like putative transporter [Planctomicrobium piriforme]|uniref:DUF1559 family PulG-like putative transporter n=1 Tax=Planctomicrobium piriforme TaxID=1576369 RepID=UPI001C313BEF|nr:DUF1559 domain-containing protein [Planctomicrobium piriforme]